MSTWIRRITSVLLSLSFLLMFVGVQNATAQTGWEVTAWTVAQILGLATSPTGYVFAGTWAGGVFRSSDEGNTWTSVNTGLTTKNVYSFLVDPRGPIYAGTDSKVFRSTDNGDTWEARATGITSLNIHALDVNSKGDIFAGTFNGVHRSTDEGLTWTLVNSGLTNVYVRCVKVNPKNDFLYAGTAGGSAFRSTDNGNSWTPTVIAVAQADVRCFAFTKEGFVLCGVAGYGVYKSTDDGATWTYTGLTGKEITSLVVNSEGTYYAGAYEPVEGMSVSTDGGTTWHNFNDGLLNRYVNCLAIDSRGVLFAGTYGFGVFRTVQPTTAVERGPDGSATSFSLSQNYPNPFNPTTTIEFALPRTCHVVLNIYNTLGQQVSELVNAEMAAGIHSIQWNSGWLPSGVYFYRFQAGGSVETRSMVLVR